MIAPETETREPVLLSLGESTFFDAKKLHPYICGLRWPQADGSIDYVAITHVLEYLAGPDRVEFINELWRVLAPGGRVTLRLPYWSSPNAHADPYLAWPPLSEMSVRYLVDAAFRERNQIGYSGLVADFELRWGNSFDPEWHVRSDNTRTWAAKHYNSVVTEIVCTLIKKG